MNPLTVIRLDDLNVIKSAVKLAAADDQMLAAMRWEAWQRPEIFLPADQPGRMLLLQHLKRAGVDARVCSARYHGPIVIDAANAKQQRQLVTAVAGLVLDAPKTTRSKTWFSSKQHAVYCRRELAIIRDAAKQKRAKRAHTFI